MAICDANYEFLYVYVGCNGRVSDSTVWNSTAINSHITAGTEGVPGDTVPQGSTRRLPYVLIVDDAFSLQNAHNEAFISLYSK